MRPATAFTAKVNRAARDRYAMQDVADFDDVDRGLIVGFADGWHSDDGKLLVDGAQLAYIADDTRHRTR